MYFHHIASLFLVLAIAIGIFYLNWIPRSLLRKKNFLDDYTLIYKNWRKFLRMMNPTYITFRSSLLPSCVWLKLNICDCIVCKGSSSEEISKVYMNTSVERKKEESVRLLKKNNAIDFSSLRTKFLERFFDKRISWGDDDDGMTKLVASKKVVSSIAYSQAAQ